MDNLTNVKVKVKDIFYDYKQGYHYINNNVKVTSIETNKPTVIIQPKSIIGLISLKI